MRFRILPLLAVSAAVMTACLDPLETDSFIAVSMAGLTLDGASEDLNPVSGIRVTVVDVAALQAQGLTPTVTLGDTTNAAGEFALSVRLDTPGNICTGTRSFPIVLQFTDTRARFETRNVPQELCLRTANDLFAAKEMRVLLSRP